METINETLNKNGLDFINRIDRIISLLPKNDFPGRYIWTPYSPSNDSMRDKALQLKRKEYFGLAVNSNILETLEATLEMLSTEMIADIEKDYLTQVNFFNNKSVTNIRFLTNRDFSNRPVIWFNGNDKYYSAFLNPSIFIPKKIN